MATGRVPTTANSPLTAKGDLFTYSTAPARLAVSDDGSTLLADSSTSTGLRWQGSMAAGRNFAINGGMDVWQRGTSFSLAATSGLTYVADRWSTATGANQASTISRQVTGDTTNLPNIQYCLRNQRNSGQTGTGTLTFVQMLETANSIPLVGKAVTFSFYARVGANFSGTIRATMWSGTGTDQTIWTGFTNQAFPFDTTFTPTTTWQRFSFTATLGATLTQLAVGFNWTPSGTAGAADYYEITGLQLELGSVATTFSRSGNTLAGELAACQKYYFRNTGGSSDSFYGSMTAYSTTQGVASISVPVTMRVEPTSIDFGNLCLQRDAGQGRVAITAATISTNYSGVNAVGLDITVASGLTAGTFYYLQNNNNTAGFVGFSAEL